MHGGKCFHGDMAYLEKLQIVWRIKTEKGEVSISQGETRKSTWMVHKDSPNIKEDII